MHIWSHAFFGHLVFYLFGRLVIVLAIWFLFIQSSELGLMDQLMILPLLFKKHHLHKCFGSSVWLLLLNVKSNYVKIVFKKCQLISVKMSTTKFKFFNDVHLYNFLFLLHLHIFWMIFWLRQLVPNPPPLIPQKTPKTNCFTFFIS